MANSSSASKVRKIKAPKDLQLKVGTGKIDDMKVNKAQKVISNNKVDFGPVSKPYLDSLKEGLAEARKGELEDAAILDSLTTPIMNLKANAATFNYPFISETTAVILMFIEQVKNVDEDIIAIVDNLHKTVTIAIAQKIIDTKNPSGAKLYKEFRNVCQRYAKKRL